MSEHTTGPDCLASDVYRLAPCGHEVRHVDGRPVVHDAEGLEPVGEGYWNGDNPEGIGHAVCRRGLPRFADMFPAPVHPDKHNAHTTSDLAGLAAREAGAPARRPTRIEEIRARVEAAVMGAGLDKFGSAIVDNFGCCVVCGKWTNPGHPDAQSHKDGCAAHREEVRYAQALHAIYRTGADDLRHLLHEVAGYQSDLLAGERALKEARRERDALRTEVERLTVLGPDTEARVTVEARAIASDMLKPVVDTWRAKVAEVEAERDIAMTALAEAEAEIRRGRPGYSWIGDDALAALTAAQQEHGALTADLARARRILAVEQGREGPEGWVYGCADGVWWRKETAGRAWRGWRWVDSGRVPVWRWTCQAQTGYAGAALNALEAADRVADEAREDGATRRVAGGPASLG